MLLAVAIVLSPNPEPGFCESHELSRFQFFAADVGVSEEELRGLVRRLIAKKCGLGVSVSDIAHELNEEGVPTATGWGRWHSPGVQRALSWTVRS